MLQQLSIQNYAIIDKVDITFTRGLNILTGETGAGKSIILGALSLILGARIESGMTFRKDKKTFIEAVFNIEAQSALQVYLAENAYANEDNPLFLTLRREIHPETRLSKIWINEQSATVSELHKIGAQLIDLQRQFDLLKLEQAFFQIQVLDALAQNGTLFQTYQKAFALYEGLKKEVAALRVEYEKTTREQDYLQFVCAELEELSLQPGELEQLEQEVKIAQNGVALQQLLAEMKTRLHLEEGAVTGSLKHFSQKLSHYAALQERMGVLSERLEKSYYELLDIVEEAERLEADIVVDAEVLQRMEERLNEGFRLLQKYRLPTTDALLAYQEELRHKLQHMGQATEQIAVKEQRLAAALAEAQKWAAQLSERRKAQAQFLEQAIVSVLSRLGMPDAVLSVAFTEETALNAYGRDGVAFLMDTNKTGRLEALGKIASGGELSRVLLAVKSLVAQKMALPAMVFDEIDTGISGEVAKQTGLILRQLAESMQIICITHQPTIAARGQTHFYIYKEETQGRIQTLVRRLDKEERVAHIAAMLSGAHPSEEVLQFVRELLR